MSEKWKTIDSLPRDGKNFLGWNKSHGTHECYQPDNVMHYKRVECIYGNFKTFSNKSIIWFVPTHWMNLIETPKRKDR